MPQRCCHILNYAHTHVRFFMLKLLCFLIGLLCRHSVAIAGLSTILMHASAGTSPGVWTRKCWNEYAAQPSSSVAHTYIKTHIHSVKVGSMQRCQNPSGTQFIPLQFTRNLWSMDFLLFLVCENIRKQRSWNRNNMPHAWNLLKSRMFISSNSGRIKY